MVESPISPLSDEESTATTPRAPSWLARVEWPLVIAVVAAWGVGKAGLNTMPLLFSALADGLGLDPERLGTLGSVELLAIAAGSFGMAPFAARVPRRKVAIGLGLLSVFGYALSAGTHSYVLLTGIRCATGLACGVVVALGNAATATSRDPDALFGWILVLASIAGFALLGILPYAIGMGGYSGGYLMVGLASLVTIPFLYWLPEASGPEVATTLSPLHATAPTHTSAVTWWAGLSILAANFVQGFTGMALWAFAATIGEHAGISLERLGWLIGLGTALLVAGALVPIAIGARWGRSLPVFVTTVAVGLSQWGLVHATGTWDYSATLLVWCIASGALFPYLIGAGAALDRLGRWAAGAGSMTLFGGAIGPVVAGAMLQRFGYGTLGWMFLASAVASLAFSLPVTRWTDRAGDTR